MNLNELGFTQEQLQQAVVTAIANKAIEQMDYEAIESSARALVNSHRDKLVKDAMDKAIAEALDPIMDDAVNKLTLQRTNQWGEPQQGADPETFREFAVKRLDAYFSEHVNYEGKPKGTDSYSWTKKGTRLEYFIDKHLQYILEQSLKAATDNGSKLLAGALTEAVKVKMAEISEKLQVTIKAK